MCHHAVLVVSTDFLAILLAQRIHQRRQWAHSVLGKPNVLKNRVFPNSRRRLQNNAALRCVDRCFALNTGYQPFHVARRSLPGLDSYADATGPVCQA